MSCYRHELENLFNLQPWTSAGGEEKLSICSPHTSDLKRIMTEKIKKIANIPASFKLESNSFVCPLPLENVWEGVMFTADGYHA
jgi:hypothetical protein